MAKKTIKAWAVLDKGNLRDMQFLTGESEYWIMPKKPKRKDYHKDFTFAQVEITLI